jgi:hypothetical protein
MSINIICPACGLSTDLGLCRCKVAPLVPATVKTWEGRVVMDSREDLAAHIAELNDLLSDAESFIAGFEGDTTQEGVDDLLERIRAVTQPRQRDTFKAKGGGA